MCTKVREDEEKRKTIQCRHWMTPCNDLLTYLSMVAHPHYFMLCVHNETAHAKGAWQYVSNLAQPNIGTMHPSHYTVTMQVKY